MHRRAFLASGGRAVLGGMVVAKGGSPALARELISSHIGIEKRVAIVVEAYDAQGNHRTATAVDNASAEWLALEVRRAGAEASIEPFALRRVDPVDCYLRIGGRRIEGVPLFDADFTGADGIDGKLGRSAAALKSRS
jgi:hypothetical protein